MIDPVLTSTSNKVISLYPSIIAPSCEMVGVRGTNSAIDSEILCKHDKQSIESQISSEEEKKHQSQISSGKKKEKNKQHLDS
jgi:hypothetical protein